MVFYGSTFRKALTYPDGPQKTSKRSLTPSTPDPARHSAGKKRPRKPSTTSYCCSNKPVLRQPIESALGSAVGMVDQLR